MSTKTITCQCWNCGARVRVPNAHPLPAEHDIFCAKCRKSCDIQETWIETCPMCRGDGQELGVLGGLAHFRCKSCGINFSK